MAGAVLATTWPGLAVHQRSCHPCKTFKKQFNGTTVKLNFQQFIKFCFMFAPIPDVTHPHTKFPTSLPLAGFFCIFNRFIDLIKIDVIFPSYLYYYGRGRPHFRIDLRCPPPITRLRIEHLSRPFRSYIVNEEIWYLVLVVTPHAQRERGKVIGRGVHIYIYIYIYIYICLWSKKIFESYFRDRLTFSNVDSRTSR